MLSEPRRRGQASTFCLIVFEWRIGQRSSRQLLDHGHHLAHHISCPRRGQGRFLPRCSTSRCCIYVEVLGDDTGPGLGGWMELLKKRIVQYGGYNFGNGKDAAGTTLVTTTNIAARLAGGFDGQVTGGAQIFCAHHDAHGQSIQAPVHDRQSSRQSSTQIDRRFRQRCFEHYERGRPCLLPPNETSSSQSGSTTAASLGLCVRSASHDLGDGQHSRHSLTTDAAAPSGSRPASQRLAAGCC